MAPQVAPLSECPAVVPACSVRLRESLRSVRAQQVRAGIDSIHANRWNPFRSVPATRFQHLLEAVCADGLRIFLTQFGEVRLYFDDERPPSSEQEWTWHTDAMAGEASGAWRLAWLSYRHTVRLACNRAKKR